MGSTFWSTGLKPVLTLGLQSRCYTLLSNYKKPVKLILMNVTYQWQHTENKCTNVKRDLTIIFYTGGPNQNPWVGWIRSIASHFWPLFHTLTSLRNVEFQFSFWLQAGGVICKKKLSKAMILSLLADTLKWCPLDGNNSRPWKYLQKVGIKMTAFAICVNRFTRVVIAWNPTRAILKLFHGNWDWPPFFTAVMWKNCP